MKRILAHIVHYKLHREHFPQFLETLNTLMFKTPEGTHLVNKYDIQTTLQTLTTLDMPLSETSYAYVDALLYRIEEIIVHELLFNTHTPKVMKTG